MIFTILRLLRHSELGMFHEYRRQKKEGSKQRAINFDGTVVDRVFPSAKDADKILINCRCIEEEASVIETQQWLKRQDKNWRFEGYCPKSTHYSFVEPGVLFAMVVDSSQSPASASWVVIPKDHQAHAAIVNHGESAQLLKSGMIALYGEEGAHCRRVLGDNFPLLFPKVELMTLPVASTTGFEPDPLGLFDILARAGHKLPSAVADLVDNSISAGATEISIHFPNPNLGGRWMCVRDNGSGMTSTQLRGAMRVGNRRSYEGNDLGKFGYGLKGASWSQADCLTVLTKASDGELSHMTWDKNHLAKTGKWEVLFTPIEAKYDVATKIPGTGTAVLLTEMRPPVEIPLTKGIEPYAVEVTSIREHLELVFHRFLEGKVQGREKVTILVNEVALVPNNPMGHPLTKHYDPRSIVLNEHDPEKKGVITFEPCITPTEEDLRRYHEKEGADAVRNALDRISLGGRRNETQGLFFYRLGRLIKWGGWEGMFALEEKTKLLRVSVDFDRSCDDALQVDISKQIVKLPVSVSTSLQEIVKASRAEARSRYRTVKRVEKPDASERQNDGISPKTTKGASPKPPAKVEKTSIRIVEDDQSPWQRKSSFTGEVVEVSGKIPALVDLVRAVEKDPVAKAALSQFLHALEKADVLKHLSDNA